MNQEKSLDDARFAKFVAAAAKSSFSDGMRSAKWPAAKIKATLEISLRGWLLVSVRDPEGAVMRWNHKSDGSSEELAY